jgi:hypothetical protein
VASILAADYYFVKKGKYNVPELYDFSGIYRESILLLCRPAKTTLTRHLVSHQVTNVASTSQPSLLSSSRFLPTCPA